MENLQFVLHDVVFSDGATATGHFEYNPSIKKYDNIVIRVAGPLYDDLPYTFRMEHDTLKVGSNFLDLCERDCPNGSKYFRLTFDAPLDATQSEFPILQNTLSNGSYYGLGRFDQSKTVVSGSAVISRHNIAKRTLEDQIWCQSVEIASLLQDLSGMSEDHVKRAAMERGLLWPNLTTLTYTIMPIRGNTTAEEQTRYNNIENIIDTAFAEWNSIGMGISFKKLDSRIGWRISDIRISRNKKRTDRSLVGTRSLSCSMDKATMNLGLRKGLGETGYKTALHEIGHAIGMIHEHQRIDSGIIWSRQGVYHYFANREPNPVTNHSLIDKNVFNVEDDLESTGFARLNAQFPYDPKSIMNYDFPAICFDGPSTLKQHGIQRDAHLTATDIATAKYFYPNLRDGL